MDGDIELEDQALDALLAVMFTERSRVSVSPQSHQSSVGGCDDSDSEQEIPRTPAINCDGLLEDHLLCDKAGSNASTPAIKRPSLSEYQIVTFDVGGQVFRCRAGRILSFPAKRLAQLITCGCARMQNSDVSFFVDRNPTHFQRILDWYRSPADAIAASVVHKDHSFQEDARYFDLYDEFFAHASKNNALSVPPRPPRQQIETTLAKVSSQTFKHALSRPRSLQELSTMPIYPVSKPVKGLRSNKSPSYQEEESTTRTLQFVKRECQTLVSETSPCIYIVRKDEELHVARVKGSGRLLLRVCDVTGMKQLHVAQAVLFDSHASFFKQDEWISLGHQGRLPGDHTYTFWLESNDSKSSKSKTSSTMQVEFTLLSSFQWNQRVDSNLRSHGAIPDAPALASLNSLALLSPSLMLPPQQQYSVMNSGTRKDSSERIQSQPNQHEAGLANITSERIAESIFHGDNKSPEKRQTIVWKNAQRPRVSPIAAIAAVSPSSSTIKRNGAIIALGSPQGQAQNVNGKMTIYHPEKLVIQERKRITSSPNYHDLQPRSFY